MLARLWRVGRSMFDVHLFTSIEYPVSSIQLSNPLNRFPVKLTNPGGKGANPFSHG